MTNNELMVRDDAQHLIEITSTALALLDDALASAALVGKVRNADDQALAVDAQKQLKALMNATERSRKDVKEPVLAFGRLIDQKARDFIAEVDGEYKRVSRAVSDFQILEDQKRRAAEALKLKELARIEREREEALAAAQSIEEVDAIQHEANDKALAETQKVEAIQPARVEGQIVRTDWEITVTDLILLARAHPGCVTITPKVGEIKALLNMGVTVQGVKAEKVTKAGVRA